MKKIMILILISILFVTGCSSDSLEEVNDDSSSNKKIEVPSLGETEKYDDKGIQIIKDNVFIQFTNDMYYNPEDYKDKKFQIEGLVMTSDWDGKDHLYVIRKTPGCCGDDGLAGLEVSWDGDIPEDDTWVVAKGIWKEEKDSTYNGWILVLYSFETKDQKGNEFLDFNY